MRYKPGTGVYGFEELIEEDGRIPAIVIGHTAVRTRIRLQPTRGRTHHSLDKAVEAASLQLADGPSGDEVTPAKTWPCTGGCSKAMPAPGAKCLDCVLAARRVRDREQFEVVFSGRDSLLGPVDGMGSSLRSENPVRR